MATQTVEQVTRLPEFQEQFLADILESARAASETGMPYAPGEIAGLSEGQQQAISSALGGVGAYQPMLQQGQPAIQAGIGLISSTWIRLLMTLSTARWKTFLVVVRCNSVSLQVRL